MGSPLNDLDSHPLPPVRGAPGKIAAMESGLRFRLTVARPKYFSRALIGNLYTMPSCPSNHRTPTMERSSPGTRSGQGRSRLVRPATTLWNSQTRPGKIPFRQLDATQVLLTATLFPYPPGNWIGTSPRKPRQPFGLPLGSHGIQTNSYSNLDRIQATGLSRTPPAYAGTFIGPLPGARCTRSVSFTANWRNPRSLPGLPPREGGEHGARSRPPCQPVPG